MILIGEKGDYFAGYAPSILVQSPANNRAAVRVAKGSAFAALRGITDAMPMQASERPRPIYCVLEVNVKAFAKMLVAKGYVDKTFDPKDVACYRPSVVMFANYLSLFLSTVARKKEEMHLYELSLASDSSVTMHLETETLMLSGACVWQEAFASVLHGTEFVSLTAAISKRTGVPVGTVNKVFAGMNGVIADNVRQAEGLKWNFRAIHIPYFFSLYIRNDSISGETSVTCKSRLKVIDKKSGVGRNGSQVETEISAWGGPG